MSAIEDINTLRTSKSVSIFWVTETQARAERITKWERDGILELDNSPGYPHFKIAKFDPEKASEQRK